MSRRPFRNTLAPSTMRDTAAVVIYYYKMRRATVSPLSSDTVGTYLLYGTELRLEHFHAGHDEAGAACLLDGARI